MTTEPRGWHTEQPRVVDACEAVANVLITPLLIAHTLRLVRFRSVAELLALVPGSPGVFLRRAWHSAWLERCGKRLWVGFGTVIRYAEARIGDGCLIGDFNRIGRVDIGDHFLSAGQVVILGGRYAHEYSRRDIPITHQPVRAMDRVVVGDDVWAGAHVTIAADVAAHTVVLSERP